MGTFGFFLVTHNFMCKALLYVLLLLENQNQTLLT